MHPDLIEPDLKLTNMVPQLGQFVDHDMTFAPEEGTDFYKIEMSLLYTSGVIVMNAASC